MADLLAWLDDEIPFAQADAAKAYGRVDALLELRAVAIRAAAEREQTELTVDDFVWRWPSTAQQRARVQSLLARVIEQEEPSHAAA